MYTTSQLKQYAARGFNLVPILREVVADLDNPLSAYLKLANEPYSYLFESVHGGDRWGRYSIIGLPSDTVLKVRDCAIELTEAGSLVHTEQSVDPLAWIADFKRRYRVAGLAQLPRMHGGLVGYFAYDCVRLMEPRLAGIRKPDPLKVPDILLMLSRKLVVFDNLSAKVSIIVYVAPTPEAVAAGEAELETLAQRLRAPLPYPVSSSSDVLEEDDFSFEFSQRDFESAVVKAQQYIIDGDIMQVVLSQRMSAPYPAPPITLYRALRGLNPSPYMFYLNLDTFHIVGSSPEILVRLENRKLTVRPIAGTRPRGQSADQDARLAKELLADPKERAEHLMLIDLGRNDLGRVSRIGSVKLTEKMLIEYYSHVMHIVSNVTSEPVEDLSEIAALAATFPAGTLSGAPKIRAMEIIDELEPSKRGIYGGAIGYLGWAGSMDTAIAIRTAVIKEQMLYIQAGAGVVHDSVPANEWQETMSKARALIRAATIATGGLTSAQRILLNDS